MEQLVFLGQAGIGQLFVTAAHPDDAQLPERLILGTSAAHTGIIYSFFYSSWDCSFSPQHHKMFTGWKRNHPPVLNQKTATKPNKPDFLLPRRERMLISARNAAWRTQRLLMTPCSFPQAEKSPAGGWAGYARRTNN